MSTENKENLSKNGKKIVFNPFPGLRPFKIEESHLFFGREGQSDEVLLKLSQNRFVGVIGPSGSGKSSFIYCGVLPILYGGFLTEVSAEWEVVVMRPGAGPIDNLAESLLRTDSTYLKSEPEERKVRRTIISTLLRSSSLGLVEAIQHLKKVTNKNYLVLVDQFEELFRFKDSRDSGAVDETLAFINLLLEAVAYPNTPIYVALTMRSDFIGECAQFSELTKKINDSHYLIPQMTRDQKRDAIEGPVAVGGAQVTSRLVQRLLNDLGDNPDQLPILQHALMRTFDYWIKYKDFDDEPIDIKHYESIGTMAEALSLHANEAFDELNDEQKLICETLFKAITEKRGESYGIRRPTRLGDIAAISHASVEEVAGVIEKFRAPGRSLLTPAAGITLTARSIIDISHESLMRIWVRLKNWVGDEADAVQMYQRLAEGASMYQRGKAGLWRPPDLQLALNWEAKHKPTLIWAQRYHPAFERTMEFLSHSKKEFETEQRIKELQAKRRLKTARVTAMVMAGLCVVAVGFLLYAFDQQAEAVAQTAIAVENQAIADKNREEADLNADSAKQASIRAQKAAEEALRQEALALIEKDKADSAAAEARRQEGFATENAELATKNADRAELEADRASKEAIRATQEAENARIAQEEATIRRYQAIAKQLALKSVEQPAERADLKGLLARQGYVFNRDNQGYQYDGDIYNGLYFALSAFKDPIASTQYDVYDNNGDIFLAVQGNNTLYSINQAGKILKWNTQSINRKADTIMSKRPGLTVKAAKLTPDNTAMVLAGQYMSRSYVEIVKLANTRERVVITGLNTDMS
ncbi:MAG: High-affnity carbon uptake protein Hat/HatR, partial [Cyclobacteriaceae bacterium]|nr:High-affnity carbon uptake protein Hat/HatR [Cyclobacteriaceae bacterium]